MRLADFWAYARAGPDQDVDPLYLFDPDLPPGLEARFFFFLETATVFLHCSDCTLLGAPYARNRGPCRATFAPLSCEADLPTRGQDSYFRTRAPALRELYF